MNDERVALVTGSTSGIGEAIARRLAHDGFWVVLNSSRSVQKGHVLASTLGSANYLPADVSQETEARRLVEMTLAHHGRLDALINNVGRSAIVPHCELAAATPALWRELYDVNVIAPWVLITAAAEALGVNGAGSVVNISSHAGVRPKGASIPYAVTKAALNHMTKLLAVALAPAVRVNAVAPGLVDTPRTAGWVEAQKLWKESSPMGRPAKPEEIGDIVSAVIASPYLTGEVIIVDGGLNLR